MYKKKLKLNNNNGKTNITSDKNSNDNAKPRKMSKAERYRWIFKDNGQEGSSSSGAAVGNASLPGSSSIEGATKQVSSGRKNSTNCETRTLGRRNQVHHEPTESQPSTSNLCNLNNLQNLLNLNNLPFHSNSSQHSVIGPNHQHQNWGSHGNMPQNKPNQPMMTLTNLGQMSESKSGLDSSSLGLFSFLGNKDSQKPAVKKSEPSSSNQRGEIYKSISLPTQPNFSFLNNTSFGDMLGNNLNMQNLFSNNNFGNKLSKDSTISCSEKVVKSSRKRKSGLLDSANEKQKNQNLPLADINLESLIKDYNLNSLLNPVEVVKPKRKKLRVFGLC